MKKSPFIRTSSTIVGFINLSADGDNCLINPNADWPRSYQPPAAPDPRYICPVAAAHIDSALWHRTMFDAALFDDHDKACQCAWRRDGAVMIGCFRDGLLPSMSSLAAVIASPFALPQPSRAPSLELPNRLNKFCAFITVIEQSLYNAASHNHCIWRGVITQSSYMTWRHHTMTWRHHTMK